MKQRSGNIAELRLLRLLKSKPKQAFGDIRKEMRLMERRLDVMLQRLRRRGLIAHENKLWSLTPEGENELRRNAC